LQSFLEISPLKKHHDLLLIDNTIRFSNKGHGCSCKDDISKKDSAQGPQRAYFQGFGKIFMEFLSDKGYIKQP
jgi:hypothetical protein